MTRHPITKRDENHAAYEVRQQLSGDAHDGTYYINACVRDERGTMRCGTIYDRIPDYVQADRLRRVLESFAKYAAK